MDAFSQYLNRLFDMALRPLASLPNVADILLISLVSGFLFLYIFKKTSNQERIRRHRDQIVGNIIQIVIYNDQLRVIRRSVQAVLGHNIASLVYAIPPLLVTAIPLIVFSTQINARYGYRPHQPGESFIVRADVDVAGGQDAAGRLARVRCEPSPGIVIETPPLRMDDTGSVFWRGRVEAVGTDQYVSIRIGNEPHGSVRQKVVTGVAKERLLPRSSRWTFGDALFNNAENSLPKASPFKTVSVSYQRVEYPCLAWNVDAIVLYFLLTLIFGVLWRPLIKVSI